MLSTSELRGHAAPRLPSTSPSIAPSPPPCGWLTLRTMPFLWGCSVFCLLFCFSDSLANEWAVTGKKGRVARAMPCVFSTDCLSHGTPVGFGFCLFHKQRYYETSYFKKSKNFKFMAGNTLYNEWKYRKKCSIISWYEIIKDSKLSSH